MIKKLELLVFLAILIVTTNAIGQGLITKPLTLGNGPQLFIDEYLIAEQSFLLRTVNNPEKVDEAIILGGDKNDQVFSPYLSVLQDPQTGLFRIWYNTPVESKAPASCHIAYMESEDGINWIRPAKILKDPYDIHFGASVLDRGSDYKDPGKRYVLATYFDPGLGISTSPDGLIWTPVSDKPVFLHNHDINSLHWDPIRKQYIAIVSHFLRGFGDPAMPSIDDSRRIPHETVSKDLINWEPIWQIMTPKLVQKEKGETQFYSMSGIVACGDLLIGLVKVLRDDLNATTGQDAKGMGDLKRKAAGIGYTVLAWSRDGRTWQRDYEPFIPNNSLPGTFDHAMAWGDAQIIVGDETFIYYGGYERGHKINRFDERHIGLARMPRDRYVSRDADFNTGTLITKPVIFNSSYITINANVKGVGRIRLLNGNREPLDSFGWIEFNGDSIDHKVEWSKRLKSVSGKVICLEFQLRDAQLFGFYLH